MTGHGNPTVRLQQAATATEAVVVADLRGYARGSAVFYDDRMVVADWVAVRVRRSVGPDFHLLARALTAPARFAAGAERTFRPWQLPVGDAMATLAAAPCSELYPVALAGCFDRGLGAYRLPAEAGAVRITFDPGAVRRHRPVFLVEGVAAGASSEVVCTADGSQLEPGVDYRWQEWPADADAVLVQLRHDATAPVTLELSCVPAAATVSLRK